MAKTGKGTSLQYCATEVGTYVKLAGLTDIGIPELSAGSVESTEYESLDNAVEKISTNWADTGELSGKINYAAAQVEAVYALFNVPKYWKVVLGDGTEFAFQGWISKLGGSLPNKGVIEQSFSITVSGLLSATAGT